MDSGDYEVGREPRMRRTNRWGTEGLFLEGVESPDWFVAVVHEPKPGTHGLLGWGPEPGIG